MSIHHGERQAPPIPTAEKTAETTTELAPTEEIRANDTPSAEPEHNRDSTIDMARLASAKMDVVEKRKPMPPRTKKIIAGTALGIVLAGGGFALGRGGNNDADAKAPLQPEVTYSAPAFSSTAPTSEQLPPAYGQGDPRNSETQSQAEKLQVTIPTLTPGEFPELPKADTAKAAVEAFNNNYMAAINSLDEEGEPRADVLSVMFAPEAADDKQEALKTQAAFKQYKETYPTANYYRSVKVISAENRPIYGVHNTHQGFKTIVQVTPYFLGSDGSVLQKAATPLYQEWVISGPDRNAVTPDGRALSGEQILGIKTVENPSGNVVGSIETN